MTVNTKYKHSNKIYRSLGQGEAKGKPTGEPKVWTKEEIQFIRANRLLLIQVELARHLGISIPALRTKMLELGLILTLHERNIRKKKREIEKEEAKNKRMGSSLTKITKASPTPHVDIEKNYKYCNIGMLRVKTTPETIKPIKGEFRTHQLLS